jgi:membrane protease YdiL (CAAX protease family)
MKARSWITRHQLVAYLSLTVGWSWLFLLAAILCAPGAEPFVATVLRVLSGVGPALVGIALVYVTTGRDGRRDYWRRAIDFRRIGGRWYAVVFLTLPLLTALSALFDILFGGRGIGLEAAADLVGRPLMILPYLVFILFFGPVPEELGWRGYALDRMQAKWSALTSSLVLGAVWAIWHLPLFFVENTYQYNLDFGTLRSWIFLASIVPQALVITWIYNNTQRSTLSAILFHFMINLAGELFELTAAAEMCQFVLWIVLAVLLIVVFGPRTLAWGKVVGSPLDSPPGTGSDRTLS